MALGSYGPPRLLWEPASVLLSVAIVAAVACVRSRAQTSEPDLERGAILVIARQRASSAPPLVLPTSPGCRTVDTDA